MQNLIFDVSANPVAAQTYKEYLGGVDWVQTSTVVISGIVIVMLVLVILIAIFKGFGKAAEGGKKSSKKAAQPAPAKAAAPAVSAPAPASAPAVQSGISGEIVAAISAAIYAAEGGKQVTIRSIRVKNVAGRNPWAAAAIADNTRPF